MLNILVVDDDPALRISVRTALESNPEFRIEEAFDGINAIEKVKAGNFNLVILDVDMPRLSGIEALKLIKEHDPSIIVLILTAFASIDDAVKAVKEGAYNYLSKPIRGEELLLLVEKALSAHRLISQIAASAPVLTIDAGRKIIGGTAQMQKVFHIINRLSKVNTPVLIRGASGTGKELVARAIHENSGFKDGKFVAINCSAIPENLFESELFGHEKGSFTGADQRKIGKFQYAEGGTLFLDEMGDLPLIMQVKLLRVLQEKVFTPVGANREIESNVRIIAATNRPLEEMIKSGVFREDLYYRLNVMPIFLPSLKERKDDLEELVHLFLKRFNQKQSKKILSLAPESIAVFKKYDWPGNIRELENVIEHAFILEESPQVKLQALPEYLLSATGIELMQMTPPPKDLVSENESGEEFYGVPALDLDANADLDFLKQKEAFEKEFILKALKMFNGRINQTALHANIPKKTLLRKIEKYGIVAKEFNITE